MEDQSSKSWKISQNTKFSSASWQKMKDLVECELEEMKVSCGQKDPRKQK